MKEIWRVKKFFFRVYVRMGRSSPYLGLIFSKNRFGKKEIIRYLFYFIKNINQIPKINIVALKKKKYWHKINWNESIKKEFQLFLYFILNYGYPVSNYWFLRDFLSFSLSKIKIKIKKKQPIERYWTVLLKISSK